MDLKGCNVVTLSDHLPILLTINLETLRNFSTENKIKWKSLLPINYFMNMLYCENVCKNDNNLDLLSVNLLNTVITIATNIDLINITKNQSSIAKESKPWFDRDYIKLKATVKVRLIKCKKSVILSI